MPAVSYKDSFTCKDICTSDSFFAKISLQELVTCELSLVKISLLADIFVQVIALLSNISL